MATRRSLHLNREIPSPLGQNSRIYWTCPSRSRFPPVATVSCRASGNKSKLRKWDWKGGVSFLSISSILYLTLENHYLSLISVLSFVKDSGASEHWQVPCTGAVPFHHSSPWCITNTSGHCFLLSPEGLQNPSLGATASQSM